MVVRESDFISKHDIEHMVKTGKRFFSGTWKTYKESPYAIYKRKVEDVIKEDNDIRD